MHARGAKREGKREAGIDSIGHAQAARREGVWEEDWTHPQRVRSATSQDVRTSKRAAALTTNWLPASELRGEGADTHRAVGPQAVEHPHAQWRAQWPDAAVQPAPHGGGLEAHHHDVCNPYCGRHLADHHVRRSRARKEPPYLGGDE